MKLSAEEIKKSYSGRQVVKGISLNISSGEIVGLLGPNGSGKTTIIQSLAGFIRPEQGRIIIDKQDVTRTPVNSRARLGLGYLAQESTVFKELTVEENLRAILERTLPKVDEQMHRVKDLLDEFGLWRLRQQQARKLSGGDKKCLEVACVMIMKPKLIMLDEPFLNIDPITVIDLKEIIKRLKARGIGILISDHNVRETLPLIDRGYVVYDGEILSKGTAQELGGDTRSR